MILSALCVIFASALVGVVTFEKGPWLGAAVLASYFLGFGAWYFA